MITALLTIFIVAGIYGLFVYAILLTGELFDTFLDITDNKGDADDENSN